MDANVASIKYQPNFVEISNSSVIDQNQNMFKCMATVMFIVKYLSKEGSKCSYLLPPARDLRQQVLQVISMDCHLVSEEPTMTEFKLF